MSGDKQATREELLDIAESLAQELVEFVEAGEESGSEMSGPRELLNEWEAIWRRTERYWQKTVVGMPSEESVIDSI